MASRVGEFYGSHPETQAQPENSTMPVITMYSTGLCPYCTMAEKLLQRHGVEHIHKIRIDLDSKAYNEMLERTHRRTVPQIFIGEHHVGGFDDLSQLAREGALTELLKES